MTCLYASTDYSIPNFDIYSGSSTAIYKFANDSVLKALIDEIFDMDLRDKKTYDLNKMYIYNYFGLQLQNESVIPHIQLKISDKLREIVMKSMIDGKLFLSAYIDIYSRTSTLVYVLQKLMASINITNTIIIYVYNLFYSEVYTHLNNNENYLVNMNIDDNIPQFVLYMESVDLMRYVNNTRDVLKILEVVKEKVKNYHTMNKLMAYLDTKIKNKETSDVFNLLKLYNMLFPTNYYVKYYSKYYQLRIICGSFEDLVYEEKVLTGLKKYIDKPSYKNMLNQLSLMYVSHNINRHIKKCWFNITDPYYLDTGYKFNINKLTCKIISDSWDIADTNCKNITLHPALNIYNEAVSKYYNTLTSNNIEWIYTMGWVLLNIKTNIKNVKVELNPIQASVLLYLSADSTKSIQYVSSKINANTYICEIVLQSLQSLQLVKSISHEYMINLDYYGPPYIKSMDASNAIVSVLI